jgi:hypothetical protein
MDDNQQYQSIIKMSYGFFADKICTTENLSEFLDLMQPILDTSGVSREEAYDELQRRHTVTVLDSASVLDDHGDHVEWFNPSTNDGLIRHIDWHFWNHFSDYLTAKGWPKGVIESGDRESSVILSRLEDPHRHGDWDRRGMVMGSVQSGKTANYTGLICKAIDAGYRLIVVLAGVHNSLRSQTQYRLNEEVLGYDLDKVQEFRGQAASIGVRAMFSDHKIAQTLTSSNERGDFKKLVAEQAGIIPDPHGSPIIMVIKKHVSILKNLIDWATSIIGQPDDSGRRVVKNVPLLVIDDECDYASVNTRKLVLDENGHVDEECNPAKTNQRIRELLNSFSQSAYIGYTATPFANIFIHHDLKHAKYGEDLFPRNFIVSLPRPTNYVGAERVFGLVEHTAAGIREQDPALLVQYIDDSDELIPAKHKIDLQVDELPDSLKEAIQAFLISCAVRRLRKCFPPHDSMLIHVTRFNRVQSQIQVNVERVLRGYVDRIRSGSDPLDDFRTLWENDFVPVTESMLDEIGVIHHSWEKIVHHLYSVARRIKVKLINGTSEDSLTYRNADMATRQRIEQGEEVPWEERGEHIIAIGGDKLSRGLTLDGLTVSYYLRASKMYDTLMQMGRWFGYRDGYLDVCRIYTTQELAEWYRFIASASVELHQELEYMALINAEPKEFGLKVLDHPGQLAITSAGKRRNAEVLDLSYSGRISETVVFDLRHSANNLQALSNLLKDLEVEGEPGLKAGDGVFHWRGISPESVVRYLRAYRTLEEAARVVDPKKIAQFIEEQQVHSNRDLKEWDVVIFSKKDVSPHSFTHLTTPDKPFRCLERKPLRLGADTLTIRRLISPSDEWIDFTDSEQKNAREKWAELRAAQGKSAPEPGDLPNGPAIRSVRPEERGLLMIYPICYDDEVDGRYGLNEGQEVTGFAVSFPSSETTHQVRYQVNSVFQDAED